MSGWSWIATVGGLGLVPVVHGLLGTLAGVLPVLLMRRWSIPRQALAMVALIVLAIPVTDLATRELGSKDDARIVLDEAVGFPVATLGIRTAGTPILMVTALVAFRALDGLKPPPVAQVERIPGGTGIVLDDVTAALLALLVTMGAQALLRKRVAEDPSPR